MKKIQFSLFFTLAVFLFSIPTFSSAENVKGMGVSAQSTQQQLIQNKQISKTEFSIEAPSKISKKAKRKGIFSVLKEVKKIRKEMKANGGNSFGLLALIMLALALVFTVVGYILMFSLVGFIAGYILMIFAAIAWILFLVFGIVWLIQKLAGNS